ncbi:MAG: hypothetical protein ACI884_002198 [Ulvibacter sp.]|jgi:hypothetical protein
MKPSTAYFIILILLVSLKGFGQNRFPVRIGDKYGFIDKNGELKIEAVFNEPFLFENKAGIFIDSNLVNSVIDTNGVVLKTYKENRPSWIANKSSDSYNYGPYFEFSEGLLAVFDTTSKKYGFIDNEGNWKIPPKFNHVRHFKEGLAPVGFWNNDPNITIATHSESARQYDESIKWGFINTNGTLVIDTLYFEITEFENGVCKVVSAKSGIESFINRNGEAINIDTLRDQRILCWSKSIDNQFLFQKNGKCIGQIYDYTECAFPAKETFDGTGCNGKYGFVDCSNNWVIEPKYLNVRPFSNGLAGIMKKVGEQKFEWGFINCNGDTLIDLQYQQVGNFSKDLAPVCKNDKWGVINTKNEIIIPFEYDDKWPFINYDFKDGLILMYKNDKQHYINTNGVTIWKEK